MKTLFRTTVVFIALNLITAGFALAQSAGNATAPQPPVSATNVPREQKESAREQRLVRSISSLSTGRRSVGTGNTVLVIPNEEIKTEELLAINEDINVMSRIFDDRLNQERLTKSNMSWSFSGNHWMADSYGMYLGRGSNKTGCMYLQGYGALFLMNVDFPLSAPPEMKEQEEKETEKEDVDKVWMDTKRQIYEPQETSRRRREIERQEVKYDAKKVENLKNTLIQALKHAANIRILKPDESVILRITGRNTSNSIVQISEVYGKDEFLVIDGKQAKTLYSKDAFDDFKFSLPTVIVIRAKKSDIDSFAKGSLNLDNFHQRVQILSYPLLSGNVAGTSTSPVLPSFEAVEAF